MADDEDALFASFMGEIKSVVDAAPTEDPAEVASVGDNEDTNGETTVVKQADTTKRKGNSEVSQSTPQ